MSLALVAGFLWLPNLAAAGELTGEALIDVDGDGLPSAADEPLVGAAVFFETDAYAVTDDAGRFSLSISDPGGIVWLRTPDACAPGPIWENASAGGGELTLLCAPAPVAELRFVVASDTHTGLENITDEDLAAAMGQAVALEPAPHFIAVTGDITQSNRPAQFASVLSAIDSIDVPFVPIPGNHDWYDGGAAYRETFGPPSYSFDAGGVHFVVINDSDTEAAASAFLALDAETAASDRLRVAFMHAPPPPSMVQAFTDAGFAYLFTGHLHSNRIHQHESLIEYNTQPLVMGGIDLSPAGYRVVSLSDSGDALVHYHQTVVNEPVIELVVPRPSEPVEGCDIDVIAAVQTGADRPRVHAVYGDRRVELAATGGWTYQGTVTDVCDPGLNPLTVEVEPAVGDPIAITADVCVAPKLESPGKRELPDWPQLGGGSRHLGQSDTELHPPLTLAWARSIGSEIHGGSPVVADGRVLVPVADFGDGDEGGVVALDLHTGEIAWRYRAGFGVRSAPSVENGVVVITSVDGTIHAIDAADGESLWSYRVAAALEPQLTSLYASATIADGTVFAGIQREFVALDLETGEPQWSTVPLDDKGWFGSQASPAHARGLIVSSFSGGGLGLTAWDSGTGDIEWQTDPSVSSGLMAAPVIVDETVYAANWTTTLTAIDLLTGDKRWESVLDEDGFSWGYGVIATPAAADGVLYVGTQHGKVYAVDGESGTILWSHEGAESVIRPAHYQGRASSFGASPVVSGALLWVTGSDGYLTAIDRASGEPIWRDYLRAPVTSGLAPAGDMLIVASYDGVVRALRRSSDLIPADELEELGCPSFTTADPPPASRSGCGCRSGGSSGGSLAAVLLAAAGATCRRRRRGP